jgi:hypothetical protein
MGGRAELVGLQIDIIVTLAPQATLAAKHATQTIPIVFVAMGDPVGPNWRPGACRGGHLGSAHETRVVSMVRGQFPSRR